MAVTGTLNLDGTLLGLPSGSKDVHLQWVITNGTGDITTANLAAGDNFLVIRSGTTVVCIVPPPGNAVALTLKGAGGDTGISLKPALPTVIGWNGGGTMILNAAAPIAGLQVTCA